MPQHFSFGTYLRHTIPWFEEHWTHTVAVERSVYHPLRFSGTFDAIGYSSHSKLPTLFDWKTARNPRDDYIIHDYTLQLAAYRLGIDHVYGVKLPRAMLVIARPTTAPDIYEFDAAQLDAAEAGFKQRLKAFYAMPAEEISDSDTSAS